MARFLDPVPPSEIEEEKNDERIPGDEEGKSLASSCVEDNEGTTENDIRMDGKPSAMTSTASSASAAAVAASSSEPSFVVPPPPSKGNTPLKERRKMALSFVTDVVKEVGPAVVRVDTETYVRDDRRDVHPTQQDSYVQQGQGSGLIFSKDGYILTNAHVVEDASKVTVTLTDGRVYSCEICGSDDIVDIAVLKITSDGGRPVVNLPVAALGDSDELNVGSIVVAVGSPGGLDNTVTMGIVSGLERSSVMVGIPHKKVDYIQTDAAINFGNSGGPLIDVESGRVIGINAAIRAHMEGTSFAIPINKVRTIMHDLSQGKEIHHGWLGLGLATCTPDWARQNNLDNDKGSNAIPEVHGAIVHRVYPRTPAEQGGLKENDIILQIGNDKVKSAEDARKLIDLAEVGETIPVTVIRGQKHIVLTVKPVDLSSRLKEIKQEKQRQLQQDRLRFQELGPFRSLLR
jgi:S1-C subfamily serine protease